MEFERLKLSRGLAVVMAVDMCSSSDIIEDLTGRDAMEPYDKAVTKLKHLLAETQKNTIRFDPYKFTGDGWILLFPESEAAGKGAAMLNLMRDLSALYDRVFESILRPHLDVIPETLGMTFGLDYGNLHPTTIFQNWEYVGRTINVACRLQSKAAPNTALVSNPAFARYITPAAGFAVVDRKHSLKNIRGGADFHCKEVALR